MINELITPESVQNVTPRALNGYIKGLGWCEVTKNKKSDIVVFHKPDDVAQQIIIPMDTALDDYYEIVREAILKVARYENEAPKKILEHLLLPPADILSFREISNDTESGNLPIDHAVRMITGCRKILLSVSHSVLSPQKYHRKLSKTAAEEFVSKCRLGQTDRGSFILNISCPIDLPATLPGIDSTELPFSRRVVELFLKSLDSLSYAKINDKFDDLFDLCKSPGISANFLESLLFLRPEGSRSTIQVSATWSKRLPAKLDLIKKTIVIDQEVFEIAEELAPQLKMNPEPVSMVFLGLVQGLYGSPSNDDNRPKGEVDFLLLDDHEGEFRARAELNTDEYAIAGDAHLGSKYVIFKGDLKRGPRINRIENITRFSRLEEENILNGKTS